MIEVNNPIQAFHLASQLDKSSDIGKMEGLIPQYLRSGIEIYSHQIYASLSALSNPFLKGFVLADEAGLGKTMEALLIMAQYKNSNSNILVVVPAPTIDIWIKSVTRTFNFDCSVLDNKERPVNVNFQTSLKNFKQGIVITTYDYLTANSEQLQAYDWDLCIFDEAHRFRTYKIKENKTANVALNIAKDAKKILLTATPIQKNEDDIFGLINFIDESIFTDYDEFHKKYFRKPENYAELRDLISPYFFRTLRSQVKLETKVTERQILTQIYKMSPQEEKLYSLIEKYISKPEKQAFPEMNPYELSLLLYGTLSSSAYAFSKTLSGIYFRLNKSANGKSIEEAHQIKEMLDLATSIAYNFKDEMLLKALLQTFAIYKKKGINQKCVIFTGNTQTQEHIYKFLIQNADYSVYSFNGTTDDEPINKFISSEKQSVLISTDKGNESLNWQEAAFVINYDFPQILLEMEQRISRCHRIGQQTDVFVLNFICPDNFSDVRMYELFYKRFNISNNILGNSDAIISGAIDGNIEQNILDTLNNVRKKKEVQIDFGELNEQFKEELEELKIQSNDILFKTFDKSIVEKTKNMAEIIKRKVKEYQQIVNTLAKYYYKDNFIDDDIFECKTSWHYKNPYAKPSKFSLSGNPECYKFSLGCEPCQSMLSNLRNSYSLKPTKLIFEGNDKLKGVKGYISSFDLKLSYGYNFVNKYCLIGVDENEKLLTQDICDEILNLRCIETEDVDIPSEFENLLKTKFDNLLPSLIESLQQEVDKNANLPISHIRMVAENEKESITKEIVSLQREIDAVKNSQSNDNFSKGLVKNQKLNDLTEKLFELKDNEFLNKSRINRETKQKIQDFYDKNAIKSTNNQNFMIYFEVR